MTDGIFLVAKTSTTDAKFSFATGYAIQMLDVLDWWGLKAWLKENAELDYNWEDYQDIRKKFIPIPQDQLEMNPNIKEYEPMERASWTLKKQSTTLQNGKAKLKTDFITDRSGNYLLSTAYYIRWIESLRAFAELMRQPAYSSVKLQCVRLPWNLSTTPETWVLPK